MITITIEHPALTDANGGDDCIYLIDKDGDYTVEEKFAIKKIVVKHASELTAQNMDALLALIGE
jgi:hypothetical protein